MQLLVSELASLLHAQFVALAHANPAQVLQEGSNAKNPCLASTTE